MKKTIRNSAMATLVVMAVACNPKTNETNDKAVPVNAAEVEQTRDSIRETAEEPVETIVIEGAIKSINQGKDGYTAEILTNEKQTYFATISIPNLKDPKQYHAYKVGETVKVKGTVWKMDEENHVKVTEIVQ
ncbi:hypothetical protein [Flavobacterium kingsejongi]|uniref:Uncharacterized protein n=1 Tax=Flavobacterium kingsejongi TaxID=1678728 RepID=A0A2S1LSS4_9FLAO|nr:hypothetical protein [Flavobacterium kingsejongi]AWG26738.1 hypothetical protein FK004_16635 [Flavobacterium kingsejongi]